MFQFITRKPLWVNILAAIVLLLLLLLIFLGSLALLTRHGKTLRIPGVTGMSYADAKKSLEAQGFEVQIQDSTYNDTVPPMRVVKQFPDADNQVKINRTVYLTINRSVAPIIEMPNLISMTLRNAELVLHHYGLQIEDTVYKPDFAKNSVLDQLYNGETIKPGTKIQQGNKITLVIGNGIGGTEYTVPDLVGLTYSEAKAQLDAGRLIVGALVPEKNITDTANAFVYRQNPGKFGDDGKLNHIRQGQTIDLWLTAKQPERKDSTQNTTPNN
jgi:beta-lactam-binding protein with PASTA domain